MKNINFRISLIITVLLGVLLSCNQKSGKVVSEKSPSKEFIDISDSTAHEVIAELKGGWPKPAKFSEQDLQIIAQALVVAKQVINDSLFQNVLMELSRRNKIDWGSYRTKLLPAGNRPMPTEFIIEQFRKRGLNKIEEFQAYQWRSRSITTGSSYCDLFPKVNINKLDRDLEDIAGTMVHERIHSFCQLHLYNTRSGDLCDLAYIAGDLTIAIYNYRKTGSKPFASKSKICQELRDVLTDHHILIKSI